MARAAARGGGDGRRAVGGAVGVLEGEARGVAAADDEGTHVGGSVVRAAEGEEVVGVVGAAVGLADDVVEVDEGGVAAAGDGAAAAVSAHDGAAGLGRDGLGGVGGLGLVDAAEVLGVAVGALDGGSIDDAVFAARSLGGDSAALTEGQGDLVAGLAFVPRGLCGEDGAGEGLEEDVVADTVAELGAKALARFVEERPRGGGELEGDANGGVSTGGIEGLGAFLQSRDHALDASGGLARRLLHPTAFALWRGHARELARRRPRELAPPKGLGHLRQGLEGEGDAEPLRDDAPVEVEETLDVLAEAGVADRRPHALAVRRDEPAAELVVGVGPRLGQGAELTVDDLGVWRGAGCIGCS